MTDITPSDSQARAIAAIKDWFANGTAVQQVFRVFGYAGTGKTTITRHAIAELGLETGASDGVLYAAFTGKAALVMTRKGTPASTNACASRSSARTWPTSGLSRMARG